MKGSENEDKKIDYFEAGILITQIFVSLAKRKSLVENPETLWRKKENIRAIVAVCAYIFLHWRVFGHFLFKYLLHFPEIKFL